MRFLTALILCWLVVGSIPVLVIVACEIRDHRARKATAAAIDLAHVRAAFDAYHSTENSPEAKVLTLPGCKPRVPTQRTGDEWFEALMDARESDFGGAS